MKNLRQVRLIWLVIGIVLLGAVSGLATLPTTHTVDASGGGDFMTIQGAIDAASSGDTIVVAPGLYEEIVTVTKSLTILGPTAGINKNGYTIPVGYAWNTSVEAVIQPPVGSEDLDVVLIDDADDVTLQGFVIQALDRGMSGNRMLIHVKVDDKTMENLNIVNNVLGPNTNVISQDGTKGRMNVDLDINPYNADQGLIDSLLAGNKIFGIEGNGNGLFVWGSYDSYGATGPSPMTGTVIEDNEFSDGHRAAIELCGGMTGLVIRDNVIHDFSALPGDSVHLKFGQGITLIRGSSDRTATGLQPTNITIENNEIYNIEKMGILMDPNNDTIYIIGNNLHDIGWAAIRVDLLGGYSNPDFEPTPGPFPHLAGSQDVFANSNRFENNGNDVQVIGIPSNGFILDASGNWWGTAEPTVVEALVNPTLIDFSPLLNSGVDGDVGTAGWQPDLTSVTVHTLGQQVGATGRISEGVDFVPAGSTVNVAAGTYAESVVLNKDNLTVTGDSGSRTAITGGLKFDTDLTGLTLQHITVSGSGWNNSVVRMFGAVTDLTIDNCVFDGGNVAGRFGFSGGWLEGDVTITDSEFKNILGWALFESGSGSGGDGSAMGTVTFANNYIHDSNGSVVFRGLSTDRTDIVNIYGNIWENIGGANGELGQHWAGLEVNRSQVVNIYKNDISNVLEGQWGEGQGVQLWDIDSLSLYLNNVTDNFEGVFVYGGSGSFSVPGGSLRYNNFSGNSEYGVKLDATATGGPLDAALNWWGSLGGPTADNDGDGTPEYSGGGDNAIGNIIFSPWLGIAPDGDAGTVGVQITGSMLIIVDDVGPAPGVGYLNAAIVGSNSADLPFTDTIEVRHGTYDASEPITAPVNIASETGSALHTTLNGNMSINGDGVLIGLPLQGFRINGDVTVGAGANATTSRINWSDLYGYMTNNGIGTFDAQYNYWGTKEPTVIGGRTTGLIDYDPYLPRNADDSYVDVVVLINAGVATSIDLAIEKLWAMDRLGQDVTTFIEYQSVAGAGAFQATVPMGQIDLGGDAGGGGAVGGSMSGTFTGGDVIEDSFTLTDPLTGDPITDAAVTLSLLGPDGDNALVFWGAAVYDEATGEYVFSIDTTGMSPGTYELTIQADDGQLKTIVIVIEEP